MSSQLFSVSGRRADSASSSSSARAALARLDPSSDAFAAATLSLATLASTYGGRQSIKNSKIGKRSSISQQQGISVGGHKKSRKNQFYFPYYVVPNFSSDVVRLKHFKSINRGKPAIQSNHDHSKRLLRQVEAWKNARASSSATGHQPMSYSPSFPGPVATPAPLVVTPAPLFG